MRSIAAVACVAALSVVAAVVSPDQVHVAYTEAEDELLILWGTAM